MINWRVPAGTMKERLRVMLEEVDSPSGRRFAIFVQLLIFLSLVAVFIETFRDLPRWLDVALSAFEWMVILIEGRKTYSSVVATERVISPMPEEPRGSSVTAAA